MRKSFYEYGERAYEEDSKIQIAMTIANNSFVGIFFFFFCSSRNRSLGSISPYNLRRVSSLMEELEPLGRERERGESRNYVVKEGSWTKGEAVRLITNGR